MSFYTIPQMRTPSPIHEMRCSSPRLMGHWKCGWCQGELPIDWDISPVRHVRHGFCSEICDTTFYIERAKFRKNKPIDVNVDWFRNEYYPRCYNCRNVFTPRQLAKGELMLYSTKTIYPCKSCLEKGIPDVVTYTGI